MAKKTAKKSATLEALRMAIHGVFSPFYCEGTVDLDEPVELGFKDRSRFEVVPAESDFKQAEALKPLLDRCKPAPFGDGKRTRYDSRVREARQLKAADGDFSVENFDPAAAGILKKIQRELLERTRTPISAELYTLNVYTSGGHFAPHKDTPRGADMFGTLVVCLPSRFYNGQLVLQHRGVVKSFDWGAQLRTLENPNRLHWAAFYGDVDHQIAKISTGARVTLTYLLRRQTPVTASPEPTNDEIDLRLQTVWSALLADPKFLPEGGTLAYPCGHLYHQDARFQASQISITTETTAMLKGRDQRVANSALAAGLDVSFQPYMFEDCVDETWQLKRFPTSKEQSKLRGQMDSELLEMTLPIQAGWEQEGDFGLTWLEPPPSSETREWSLKEGEESATPASALLHSCDYCPWGYFGNESSYVDFYTYAALHIVIPGFADRTRAQSEPEPPRPAARKRSPRSRKPGSET